MKFLHHLPTSLMVLVSILASNRSMSPTEGIEHELTYSGLKTTCNPVRLTAAHRSLTISVLHTVDNLLLYYTVESGMWPLETRC